MNKLNRNDLLQAVQKEPGLCALGLFSKGKISLFGAAKFEHEKEILKGEFDSFEICIMWLWQCKPLKRINRVIGSSYHLKDFVEKWSGIYISNGAFIAAAIHLGLPYKSDNDSVNLHIGISGRSPRLQADLKLLS